MISLLLKYNNDRIHLHNIQEASDIFEESTGLEQIFEGDDFLIHEGVTKDGRHYHAIQGGTGETVFIYSAGNTDHCG